MEQFVAIIVITALIIGYASLLLVMRLRSEGATSQHIRRILIELWSAFVLIFATFLLSNRLLGEAPRSGLSGELTDRWQLFLRLPPGQQALLGISILASLLLFLHLLWSLRGRPAQE